MIRHTHIHLHLRDSFEESKHPRAANGQFGAGLPARIPGSGGIHDNPVPKPPKGTPNLYEARTNMAGGAEEMAPIHEIDVRHLITTQPMIEHDRLKPWREDAPPVHVVKFGGKMWLTNGNHRASSAVYHGVSKIKARLLDLDDQIGRASCRERVCQYV